MYIDPWSHKCYIKVLQENSKNTPNGPGGDLRVVAHSSGNHAQALSLAAKNCGIPADIVMPKYQSCNKDASCRRIWRDSHSLPSICASERARLSS